ncbi:hypothetical protein [Lysobacter gummosus]|uniref:hypothetical protein n=1 Tax=Lysobacter gummosus TaxID=262324 RepID=UPI003628CF01
MRWLHRRLRSRHYTSGRSRRRVRRLPTFCLVNSRALRKLAGSRCGKIISVNLHAAEVGLFGAWV